MSSYSGEAAEQVVRMTLNGVEIAAKISGKAAERIAVLLYAVLRDQKKTRGRTRLTGMLKSGRDLRVFAIRDGDLQRFCKEAKKYGILYCVLKDNNANDGVTDIFVRAEDAGKVNRIFERFGLAVAESVSLKTEIRRSREAPAKDAPGAEKDGGKAQDRRLEEYLKQIVPDPPEQEGSAQGNPTTARTATSGQSGPSSGTRHAPTLPTQEPEPQSRGSSGTERSSVRKELRAIQEAGRRRAAKPVRTPDKAVRTDRTREAR